jgi:mRNA-degrading endonuclease RelE of RelBE toxin-antitoxin system
MMHITLHRQAQDTLRNLRDAKMRAKLELAIDEIAGTPRSGPGIKKIRNLPDGYRRRVGRYRILYTVHDREQLVRVWIIAMEKDTKKDYQRWMDYILRQQSS